MAMNRVQFQQGLLLQHFMELYGTEDKCEASLEQARWAVPGSPLWAVVTFCGS